MEALLISAMNNAIDKLICNFVPINSPTTTAQSHSLNKQINFCKHDLLFLKSLINLPTK